MRDLRKEVGNDAARLFYVMRSNDQHLDFDMELAKSRSNENPVYYIQYAHARVASVMRQLEERGLTLRRRPTALTRWRTLEGAAGAAVDQAHERATPRLIKHARRSVRRIRWCISCAIWRTTFIPITARTNSSSRMPGMRDARLDLALATQIVIRNGLKLLGVSALRTRM